MARPFLSIQSEQERDRRTDCCIISCRRCSTTNDGRNHPFIDKVKNLPSQFRHTLNYSSRPSSPSSQHELTASIVTPQKSITRKPSSRGLSDKAVALSHDQLEPPPASSTLSHHRPLSNTSSGLPRLHATSISTSTCSRHNRSSSGFTGYTQYFLPPGLYSCQTSSISTSSSQVKPVCQLFKSALPDELSLARYSEYLTVLRSFNDGWCLVARDTSRSSRSSRASPLSPWMESSGDNVDVGLVPACVFVEPSRGVTVTRPFRVESINALRPDHNPALRLC